MTTRIVEIKADLSSLAMLEAGLKGMNKQIDKATKRASKRTASKGFTGIRKQITKLSNIKAAVTKDAMKKGSEGKTGAFIMLKKTPRLGVRHFKAQQDQKGVKYQIGKGDKWLYVPGAFQGPHAQATKAFEKKGRKFIKLAEPQAIVVPRINPKWKGNAAVRVGKSRLPIVFLKGVSPAGFFAKRKLVKPNRKEIVKFFQNRFQHELRFELSKLKKKKK